jgi:hypothetical protein
MSVQKKPDRNSGLDNKKVQWEQDLKPFTRLPRSKHVETKQRLPGWVSLLASFAIIVPVCLFGMSQLSRLRPAANLLAVPTSTLTIITPTVTPFVPPTATPYIAPSATPPPTAGSASAGGGVSGYAVGSKVKVFDTGGGGLNMRDNPTTKGALLRKLPEGSVYEIVGGPRDADGYTWWQLKDPADGVTGWGAQRFLQVSP